MEEYTEQIFVSKKEQTTIITNRRKELTSNILKVASMFNRALSLNEWDDESLEGFRCFAEKNNLFFGEPEEYEVINTLILIADEWVLEH